MVDTLWRESFDVIGSLDIAPDWVSAGWVVHQGSFSDCNPIWNESRDICLILTGEEFSEGSDLRDLRSRGHCFEDEHASYLVHAYEESGAAFIERLNGQVSGLLVDLRTSTAILFNDRYGLCRIYIHETPDGLMFASEAKCILRLMPQTRRLDETALAQYVSSGCAMQNQTLFNGISVLPPGSRWIFSNGDLIRKEIYFHPAALEHLPRLAPETYFECFQRTFKRVVPQYLKGNDVGISLTGGLDSRMIMAAADADPAALPCFTFGSSYRDSADVALARRVADTCAQPHCVIKIDRRFTDQFDRLAPLSIFISDGTMDVTGAVELYANRVARCIATVRVTGNYGSEVLRGNIAFKPQPPNEQLYAPDFCRLIRSQDNTYHNELDGHPVTFILGKQMPWHHQSRLSIERSQLCMRSPYLDNAITSLAYQAPIGWERSKLPALRFVAINRHALGRVPTDRGLRFPPTATVALLNAFHEFTFRAEYVYDYGMPQWLALIDKRLSMLHLERAILGRHKFYHFRVWYRQVLNHYVQDVLCDPRSLCRPHIASKQQLQRIIQQHIRGARNYTTELHQALSIELIYRELLERDWTSNRDLPRRLEHGALA
jgi:asparagine synthase (glutamine-hydrolysing)